MPTSSHNEILRECNIRPHQPLNLRIYLSSGHSFRLFTRYFHRRLSMVLTTKRPAMPRPI